MMSLDDLTGNKRFSLRLLLVLLAGGCLGSCVHSPQPKSVYVRWQALLVYHPLWEAPTLSPRIQPASMPLDQKGLPALVLPESTLRPMDTHESERRRERVMNVLAQQQQSLSARLRQMEARLLQRELAQLEVEQRAEIENAQREALQQASQQTEDTLRQQQPERATAEIRKHVLQRLWRIRPDLRDVLTAHVEGAEAQHEHLSQELQRKVAQIDEQTKQRLHEHTEAIAKDYERKREELRERSVKRLQAEQLRASMLVRAFADNPDPMSSPQIIVTPPPDVKRPTQQPPRPQPPQPYEQIQVEQDVKNWIIAICRKHRWVPVWQFQAGIPDVTLQIANEMGGKSR